MATGVIGDNPALACSPLEAAFLASLLGAKQLPGLPDPTAGWLSEEIVEAWARVQDSLQRRRLIEIDAAGQISLDTAAAALVGTWAFPDCSFALNLARGRNPATVRYFHVNRHLAVEQDMADPTTCRLAALEDAPAVYLRIIQLLSLDDQPAAPGSIARLPEASFELARSEAVMRGPVAGEDALASVGVGEPVCRWLACALADPVMSASFVALTFRTTSWDVGAVVFIEGKQGLWRLCPASRDGDRWIDASPCSATQVREGIRRLMNRVLTEPLSSNLAS